MESRLYSYIVQCDNGGAPCIENEIYSLAICKPGIRKGARVGDIIIGICGTDLKLKNRKKQILYIAFITQKVSMREYAIDFSDRSDSIYTSELLQKPNPFHTHNDSSRDINGDNVLLSNDFIYFGKNHIDVPESLKEIIPHRGFKYKPNNKYKNVVVSLYSELKENIGIGKKGDYNSIQKNKCSVKNITNISC